MTGKLQRLIDKVTLDRVADVASQIVDIGTKVKYLGRAHESRLATIETRLGIPTPPKFAKRELPAEDADGRRS
jgi:hypothetical protein